MSDSYIPPEGYRKVAFYSRNRLGYCVSDGEKLRRAARMSAASFENAYIEEDENGFTVYAHFSSLGLSETVPTELRSVTV